MPSVPRYSQPQVDQRPLPASRTSPDAPIEAFGGGRSLERVTNAAQNLVQTGADIYEAEKRKADEIAVRDADIASAELSSQLELGVRNLQGKDAATAPDYVNKEWTAGMDKIKSGLKNDSQRQAAERILQMRRIQLNETAQLHMANEFKKYDAEQFDNAIKIYRANGSMKYNRPGAINGSIIQQESEIDRFADRNKLPDEWKNHQKAVAKSATYRDVLERMLVDGNDNQAKAYEKSINKFILPDDVSILDKVRREDKIKKEQLNAQYERGVYLTLADSTVPTEQKITALTNRFRAGDMTVPQYERFKSWVLQINDDPEIPVNKKVDVYLQLQDEFKNLEGVETNPKTGTPIAPAEGNDIADIKKFRENVAKNRKYLTAEQERNYQLYTETDFDAARAPKRHIFDSLRAIMPLLPNLNPMAQMDILNRGMAIFDKKMPVQQAAEQVQKLKDEAVVTGNPNRTKYAIGDVVVNAKGERAEVVRYDQQTGNPVLKILK